MGETHFFIQLPLPPTVNAAYNNVPGRGRVSSKAKKAWTKRVYPLLPPTPIQKRPLDYGVIVHITISLSSWRSDIDNYTKLLVDAVLPTLGLDDRYVEALTVRRNACTKAEEGAAIGVWTYARV